MSDAVKAENSRLFTVDLGHAKFQFAASSNGVVVDLQVTETDTEGNVQKRHASALVGIQSLENLERALGVAVDNAMTLYVTGQPS